jgi:hypothetical protein
MERKSIGRVLGIAALILVMATATSWAYRGMGNSGFGNKGGCGGYALSQQNNPELNEKRTAFYESTKSTRDELYRKGLALQTELAQEAPDREKALGIQREISRLRSELDQARLQFQMDNKDLVQGCLRGGVGNGNGMKSGGGKGNCWQ